LYKVLNGETTIEEILRVTGGSNEEWKLSKENRRKRKKIKRRDTVI
jgi:hypothetical protein